MSIIGNKRLATVRRPSPSRDDAAVEETFQSKLEEIKRLRMQNKPEECPINPPLPVENSSKPAGAKTVMTVNGAKTFLKSFGDWVEVVSKSGKVYYYNKRTLVNQWKKPECWLEEEDRLNAPPPPPLPPPAETVSQPPQPPPPDDSRLKLKLMTLKKIHRLKNPEASLPLAYQKSKKRLDDSSSDEDESKKPQKLTVETAFEDPDEEEQDQEQKLAKLDPEDEIGHLKPDPIVEEPKAKTDPVTNIHDDSSLSQDSVKKDKDSKDCRKFDPRISGPERAENLIEGCAAQLAFKNISRIPEASLSDSSQAKPGNPTFFTEYNLPCTLRRCKFPKEQVNLQLLGIFFHVVNCQDVLHELKLNKLKKRTFIAPPILSDLDPKLSHLAKEAQMDQFMAEVKNYNNHDRLMTSRMDNVLVYKIPDDVWER